MTRTDSLFRPIDKAKDIQFIIIVEFDLTSKKLDPVVK